MSEEIDNIRSRFHDEWLLITVDEVDSSTGQPSKGTLIDHGKSADDLWKMAEKRTEPVMVLYSDDWPEDLAACFVLFK